MKRLMNGLLYQAAWFAVIMSAQDGVAWAGALVAAAVVGIHLLWNDNRYQEAFIVLTVTAAGVVVEGLSLAVGFYAIDVGTWLGFPFWMLSLWAVFATTLRHALGWLAQYPRVVPLVGALAGPLAYWGESRLGPLVLSPEPIALVGLAVLWAVVLPLLVRWAHRPFAPIELSTERG